jgi:hypothetical protein
MRTRSKTTLLGILSIVSLTAAASGQTVGEMLKSAKERQQAREFANAAELFGRAAAKAHRDGDIRLQLQVADELRGFAEWTGEATLLATGKRYHRTQACLDVLAALDRKRASAVVAPAAIAIELVKEASVWGPGRGFDEVVATLQAQSSLPGSGKCVRLMARYAAVLARMEQEGAASRAESRPALVQDLHEILKECLAEDWFDFATYVSLPLAFGLQRVGDDAGTRVVIGQVGAAARPEHWHFLGEWYGAAGKRFLGQQPPAVFDPINEATERVGPPPPRGTIVPPKPPAPGPSEAAKALGKLSANAAMVTVRRLDDGFVIERPNDPASARKHPLRSGISHASSGGFVFAFRGRAVGFHSIEMTTSGPAVYDSKWTRLILATYLPLAKGETLSVTKTGIATIASK